MVKRNCWEVKSCGRESGGLKTGELGICPASLENRLDGANGGEQAGRCCWVVAGTLCGGKVQGSYAIKTQNCMQCDFYRSVRAEEAHYFQTATDLLVKLR